MIDTGFVLGLDLGQADDYTALAVVQRFTDRPARPERYPVIRMGYQVVEEPPRDAGPPPVTTYHLVALERLRRVPYPDIVTSVTRKLGDRQLAGDHEWRRPPQLVVDATGVGRPVVDLFRAAGLKPVAVTITGGDAVGRTGGYVTVPKRDLVGALVVLLQTGRLKIQKELAHAETLQRELMNFRVKINAATAHDSYNARDGEHDDLVLAAALACWQGERAHHVVSPVWSTSYMSL